MRNEDIESVTKEKGTKMCRKRQKENQQHFVLRHIKT